MQIEVYTRAGCSRCVTLKEILRTKNVGYTEHILDETVTREQLLERFPHVKMLPVVVCDSVLTESEELLKMLGESNGS